MTERILSSIFYSDWMEKLEATFEDLNLKYEGGESSNEAKNRIIGVVNDILASDAEHTIVVAHGGIISLLLNHYDKNFGFEQWKALGNPDIYLLSHSQNDVAIKRLWVYGKIKRGIITIFTGVYILGGESNLIMAGE